LLPFDKPSVRIGKGGLEALLTLVPVAKEPAGTGFWVPSLAELQLVLREAGVHAPLDETAVKEALERVSEGLRTEVVAARGIPPEPGKDGWLEVLVDLSGPIPPSQAERGNVDLKSSSLIRNVSAGQPLAVVHPPEAGRPGLDVTGKVLPSGAGAECEPRLGSNVKRADNDPLLLVASTDGHVRMLDGVLEVQECFLVRGDVDYASGNIAFAKSVQAQGDVKSGFSVEAGGDIEIHGLVEDCRLKAGGKVFVRGGFTGGGKGVLEAGDEISLAYVRNQTVRGAGDIVIAKEAVNARLQSRGSVKVAGLLAGGRAQAKRAVICQVAGTEMGTPTLLEAGHDYAVAEEMAEIRKVLGDMGRYARKLEEGLRSLEDLERINRSLERWSIELVFEAERMRSKVEAKIAALRERFGELEALSCDESKAMVQVRKKAYPGTVIRIGDDTLRVEEPIEGPSTFRSKDGLIVMLPGASA
jgi:uncharacterized protein (DUF342 family)